MRHIWTHGPSTVREVHRCLSQSKPTGYTTILKLMQIMHEKGLLWRDASQRSHVYGASAKENDTQTRLVDDLMQKAFGGSARKLVMHALQAKKASKKEIAEINRLLEGLE